MRTRFAFLAAILAVGLSFIGCSGGSAGDAGAGKTDSAVAEVTLTKVARGEIREIVTVTGTVAAPPNQDVRVSAMVPGRISEMHVAEGDRVRIGEMLAMIDPRPYRDQLRQAEAAAEQAKANLENAKLNRARNETLFGRGIAARKDLEDARTQESVAAAALRQSEAALELAHLQLARTELLSPLNGMVAKRFVSVGEQVDGTAAQPVLEVANLAEVELIGNLPASYMSRVHSGEMLSITSDTLPGKTLAGRIVAISPAVDPATNVGVVRIRIANPDRMLRLGMFLSAQVAVETHKNALVVPPQAIYRDEQGQRRVYLVEQDNATAVAVELGIETAGLDELLSGVKEGDTIILSGGYGLGEKAKIKTKP
jgi:membrane fusion protein (multidrug efflux system)